MKKREGAIFMEMLTELQLQIPKRMTERLTEKGDKWNNAVFTVFQRAKNHFCNDPVFFPYYTFHGVSHTNVVLKFADKLIPDGTMNQLDGKAIFVLVSGIILHDLGMHLRAPGAKRVIYGDWRNKEADRNKGTNFATVWNEYLDEVRRFSEEKMLYHFGMNIAAEAPNLDGRVVSENDRLLVGEFLRRYHHVLAQEIQKSGFPTGAKEQHLIFDTSEEVFSSMSNEWILAGILALSHGMSIRDAEKTVYSRFGNRADTPCNVPIFYLMAVLRMADYLDAGEHRVPVVYSVEEKVPVPISASEWNWNELINADSFTWEEGRENLRIQADPKGNIDFIQLEKWLHHIQQELDLSWAAIAEYYGTGKWDLSIHRIICNIQDPEVRKGYEKSFLTKEARLTANPEIMKLMIAPLYGDDPTYGVRELIQNAVDACNERRETENAHYRGIVDIHVDSKAKTLTITDNGKGMNEHVLLNYYLSAGATYRKSDDWIREHVTDGKPNVIRNGRFGVGVLATFLLGNRITVTTRHRNDQLGYRFEFGQEPAPLEVKRVSCDIGTKIVVNMTDATLKALRNPQVNSWYNWYAWDEPSVRYWMDGRPIEPDAPIVPRDQRPFRGWYSLRDTELEMVRWGFPGSGFYCNGILIPRGDNIGTYIGGVEIRMPSISVIDRDARLPLDLARSTVLQFPERDQLYNELCKLVFAQLFKADWSGKESRSERLSYGTELLKSYSNISVPYLCSDEGFTVTNSLFAQYIKEKYVLKLCLRTKRHKNEVLDVVDKLNPRLPYYVVWHDPSSYRYDLETVLGDAERVLGYGKGKTVCFWTNRFDNKIVLRYRDKENETKEVWAENGLHQYQIGDTCVEPPICREAAVWDQVLAVVLYEVDWNSSTFGYLPYLTKKYLGENPWIPYDMKKREELYPEAFKDLAYYMENCPEGPAPGNPDEIKQAGVVAQIEEPKGSSIKAVWNWIRRLFTGE